jgi:hypothetical protein
MNGETPVLSDIPRVVSVTVMVVVVRGGEGGTEFTRTLLIDYVCTVRTVV